jgi:CHAD domain-containing protein
MHGRTPLMNCLNQYRSKLLETVNRELRAIVTAPEEYSIHRFRVGIKRLTALYRFLGATRPEIKAKQLLKPARRLSSSISRVRDCHITLGLISELAELDKIGLTTLQQAVHSRIRKDYREFQKLTQSCIGIPLRLPTIRSMKLSENAIRRHKPEFLQQLLTGIANTSNQSTDEKWHKARILLKRYHHTLDAFIQCPGQRLDEKEMKQIEMLERLLGDWHDRVIAVDILRSFKEHEKMAVPVIDELYRQQGLLLGSARIYLDKFNRRQNWD